MKGVGSLAHFELSKLVPSRNKLFAQFCVAL
jgi:hypothetical protein